MRSRSRSDEKFGRQTEKLRQLPRVPGIDFALSAQDLGDDGGCPEQPDQIRLLQATLLHEVLQHLARCSPWRDDGAVLVDSNQVNQELGQRALFHGQSSLREKKPFQDTSAL